MLSSGTDIHSTFIRKTNPSPPLSPLPPEHCAQSCPSPHWHWTSVVPHSNLLPRTHTEKVCPVLEPAKKDWDPPAEPACRLPTWRVRTGQANAS